MSRGETGKMNPDAGPGIVEGHQLTDQPPSTAPALTAGCYPKSYDFHTHMHTCRRPLKSSLQLHSTGACFVLNRARFNAATQSIHFYLHRPPLRFPIAPPARASFNQGAHYPPKQESVCLVTKSICLGSGFKPQSSALTSLGFNFFLHEVSIITACC